ncbi:MAG TPA: ATP-binding protein [Candidatus Limnocylindrales bacterium]
MDPVILLIESIFYILFAVALWRYLRQRTPVDLGVAAVFSTTAALFLLSFISAYAPGLVAIVRPISYAALVAQPYLIIRLLDLITPVPRWASWAALGGFLVVAGGLLVSGPRSLPVILAAVAYFFVAETMAALQFMRLARRRRGVHRLRLTLAGLATGLFGLVIVIAGLGSASGNGGGSAPGVLVASRLLALVAALGYLAAFAPPRWIMGFFHRAAAFDLARSVVAARPGEGSPALWGQLAEAAEAILGATDVRIVDTAGHEVELDRGSDGPSPAPSTSTPSEARRDRTSEVAVGLDGDGGSVATLYAHLEGRPLFVGDDIAIVSLLGSLTARAVRHGEDLARLQATALALEQAAAVRASDARFRILLEADPNAILATDDTGRIGWSTRSSEELFGFNAGELTGRELATIVDLSRVEPAPASADDEQIRWVETEAYRADGSVLPVELALRHIDIEGQPTTVAIVSDSSWRQEANEIRDRFIGILSHELRTPITSIYGGAQILMKRHSLDEPTRTELLAGLADESDRLQRMIENLLILARVERGAEFFEARPVLVQRLLAQIIERERVLWPSLTISLDAPSTLPVISGDEDQLTQVMRNFLSNAAKYAGDNAHIDVQVRYAAPWVSVTVSDDGPGFPSAAADDLFSLYYRAAGSEAASGAGIGLYVCRHLVEAMGGTVWARNKPNGGAEFGFTLAPYLEPEDELHELPTYPVLSHAREEADAGSAQVQVASEP